MNMRPIGRLAMTALIVCGAAAHAAPVATTFRIQMTITSSCAVTTPPGDINLGAVAARSGVVNVNGGNTIKVNCTKNTPFFIGLAPSDGNRNGQGTMHGALGGNTDKVPYRLYSNAGLTRAWGNTATRTRRGNGVAGTGAGMAAVNAVSFPAYAKVTNVDFRPDRYADTVTVRVQY